MHSSRAPLALVLVTQVLAGAGCRRHEAKVDGARAALSQEHAWWITVEGGPPTVRAFWQAPQSSQLADLYVQVKNAVQSACGTDSACVARTVYRMHLLPGTMSSVAELQRFSDGQNAIGVFFGNYGLSAKSVAESYADMEDATDAQYVYFQSLGQRFVDARQSLIDHATKKIRDQATPLIGQALTELAETKQKIRELKAITDAYVATVTALGASYTDVANAYQSYRAGETDANGKLTAIANAASASHLEDIPAIEQQLIALDAQESLLPEQLAIAVGRLSSQLGAAQATYERALEPYTAFMAAHGLAKADTTSVALRSLDNMYAYSRAREKRVQDAVVLLNQGLQRRVNALVLAQAAAASQPALLQAAQLAASTNFINDMNGRVKDVWKDPPTSTTLQLTYVAAQYDGFVTFLQLEPMCQAPVPSYMQTGCNLLRPEFSRAHGFIDGTLPGVIAIDLDFMTSANVDASAIADVNAELQAGNLAQATRDHDTLLRETDLPPPAGGADGGVDDEDE